MCVGWLVSEWQLAPAEDRRKTPAAAGAAAAAAGGEGPSASVPLPATTHPLHIHKVSNTCIYRPCGHFVALGILFDSANKRNKKAKVVLYGYSIESTQRVWH